MQKRSTRSLQLAALLAASASGQTITSTIPVCPTASSTTITLPTTVTFCPGPHCNGGAPMPTSPPNGVGMQGHYLGDYTSVGADGKTTVLGIHETVYDSLCSTGLVPATYTITEECGCTEAPSPTVMPAGFVTTVVPCHVCGEHSPMVTLTQPAPNGPYASQTSTVNQSPAPAGAAPGAAAPAGQAPAAASAGAGSGAGASASSGPGGASAGADSGSGAGASAGTVSPVSANGASAGAGSGSDAGADASTVSPASAQGASAGADSGSDAMAQADSNGASAGAGSGAGASANAGTVSPASAAGSPTGAGAMMVAPVNGTMGTNGTKPAMNAPIQSFVSSATHASIASFTIFAGVIAALLL